MDYVELRFLATAPGQKEKCRMNAARFTGKIKNQDVFGPTGEVIGKKAVGEKMWLGWATYQKDKTYRFTREWADRMLELGGWEEVKKEKQQKKPVGRPPKKREASE